MKADNNNNLETELQFGKRTQSGQKTIDQKNLFVFDFWIWLVSIVIPVLKVEKHNHAMGYDGICSIKHLNIIIM